MTPDVVIPEMKATDRWQAIEELVNALADQKAFDENSRLAVTRHELREDDELRARVAKLLELDLTLTIYDRGAALIELGIPVQELQNLPMLAKARRCKSIYNSEQVDGILAFHRECEQTLEQIRLEYAKQGEHA